MIRTLLDLARERASTHHERGFRFLGDGVSVSESLAFADLDRDARRIAVALRDRGAVPGSRALLVYPPGLEFVRAFWGCVYAGVIAVPAPPPEPTRIARTLPRLRAITHDCQAQLLLAPADLAGSLDALGSSESPRTVATDTIDADAAAWRAPPSTADDLAVLQYTSGSTSTPRGVMLSHANLLHNLDMLRVFHRDQEHLVMLHWLPLYHDMGLIRGMLSPLHMGGDCVMMAPLRFVERPLRWLAAITAHRATITGAPNFGYEYCARKIAEAELATVDLSTLEVAFCSSEPIRKQTIDRFVERFARRGFRADAFRPAYGLAEATVMVSGELGEGHRSWRVDAHALRTGTIVQLSPHDDREARELISCGRPLGGQEVVIVDDHGRVAPDRVGEVWVRGPSVARGYWANPAETDRVFGARLDGMGDYLRTGDLGWIAPDGGICITGRQKDLIVVRGQNHYPQDLEATAEAEVPELRPGCTAAFGIDSMGSEVVVLMCETGREDGIVWAELVAKIRTAVGERHGVSLHAIVILPPGRVPKTASGKIQRSASRQLFLDGHVEARYVAASEPDREP